MTHIYKISENDSLILTVWIDKWDEKKKDYIEKDFSISVKGKHLCIADNSCSTMRFKEGFWHDKEKAPFGKILQTIFEVAMKRRLRRAGFIYIKLED